MPSIPIPEYQRQVTPGGVGVTPRATATPVSGIEGAAFQQLGGALQQGEDTVAAYAAQFQRNQREADARDGDVQLAKTLDDLVYNPQGGYFTRLGRDAVDGYDDFRKSAEDAYAQARAGLKDDETRRVFDSSALKNLEYTLKSGSAHAAQQNKVWQVGAIDSRIQTYQGTAANYFNDPARFDQAVGTIRDEVANKGRLMGWSADQVNAEATRQTSGAWQQRIERTALYDPLAAMDMYRQNSAYVDPKDRPVLEHKLKTAVLPVQVKSAADFIMSQPEVEDFGRALEQRGEPLVNAIMQTESGGDQSAVSKKGAVGVMQVMPDTARDVATEMGLPFDAERLKTDAGYNKALGERYFRNMLARYAGNTTLALAAYNAGPGAVDKWVRQYGNPNTGEISNSDWAAAIPYKETRDYLSKVSAKATGAASPTNKRDTQAQLAQWVGQAEQAADAMHPGDPVFRDMLVSAVKGRVATITQMQDGVQRQAQGRLINAAIGEGGNAPTSTDVLLSNPDNNEAWGKLDPQAKLGVIALIDRNARGDHVTTNPQVMQEVFDRIHLDENDPNKIRSASELAKFMGHGLNFTDYSRLQGELEKSRTPEGNAFLKDVQTVRSTARRMLHSSIVGQIQGDVAEEASYRFSAALDQKIDQYRKEKKDPRDLFNPAKPDYVLAPGNVQSFMPTARDAAAKAASNVATGKVVPLVADVPRVATDEDFAKLPPGAEFIDPKGVRRRKP